MVAIDAGGTHARFALATIGDDGSIEGYAQPYPSQQEAMWSAKAAAEYAGSDQP